MPKHKKPWRKAKARHEPKAALNQPVAKSVNTVACRICGLAVDAKRMQFHMVRFHGAVLRPIPPA